MKKQIKQLRDFQKHINVPLDKDLTNESSGNESIDYGNFADLADCLEAYSIEFEKLANAYSDDARYTRAHLIVEEVSEVIDALMNRDEIKLLDALSDLMYVTIGTATTYDLPLAEAFEEVHKSNMTKQRKVNDVRCRDKGNNYIPPNLAKVLNKARTGR